MERLLRSIRIEYGSEIHEKVADVTSVLRSKIVNRNLFGWTYFINDVLTDVVAYMIQTDFQYSGGAYVYCGWHNAVSAARYCGAQKRRGNYDYRNLDIDEVQKVMVFESEPNYSDKAYDLYIAIEYDWGHELAEELKPFINGEQDKLSKDLIAKCKSPEFIEWLRNFI